MVAAGAGWWGPDELDAGAREDGDVVAVGTAAGVEVDVRG